MITIARLCVVVAFLATVIVLPCALGEPISDNVEGASTNASIITFHIEHALDPLREEFTPRTRIQLMIKPDGRQGLKYLDRNVMTGEDVLKFKNLVATKDLYTIRMRVEKADWKGHFVTSSIPVCDLLKVGFKEDISVFLSDFGNIVGLDYHVPKMTIAKECDASKMKDIQPFQTRISIADEYQVQPLPIELPGARPAHLQNVKLSEGSDSPQQQKQNQSFLSKYWYIVLGLVMYMFVGGAEPAKDPKQTQENQDGKAGQASNTTTAGKGQAPSSFSAPSTGSRAKKE